jgi:signal transduction histidine kinase
MCGHGDSSRTNGFQATRSLQLAVGIACAVIGAEALVVPSRFVQFVLSPYDPSVAGLAAWGAAFIGIGACLCGIGVLNSRRRTVVAISVSASVVLGLVCALRVVAGEWADAALYGCAGLFIVAAAYLPATVAGAALEVRGRRKAIVTTARMLFGLVLIGFSLTTSAARHDWAATALYLSPGVVLVVGARLSPTRPLDFSSVRVRLVFMTVILTSGSLILASLAIATSAESTTIADAVADQQLAAGEVSHNLSQADSDYRGVVTTLAARGGLAQLNPDQQRALLQGLTATNVYDFSTYDTVGQPVARSDDRPVAPLPQQLLTALQTSSAAAHGFSTVPGTSRLALIFAAPYASPDAATAGYVAAELDVDQLNQALGSVASVARFGTSIFVLDPSGAVILHPLPTSADAAEGPPGLNPSVSDQAGGTLRYRTKGMEYAAAYATIPSLGWSVISAYPVAYALNGVQTGREWAFGLLVLAAALSTVLSMIVAERVIAPLNGLGNAMDKLAADATPTPLPHSPLTEVQRLTELFGTMRERLMLRTVERERALDSAREAIRVREEFMSIAAHELKTPVTATRGHAQLLLRHMRRGDHLDPARVRDSLERINSQSQKLARLIDQLLDVARLERGALSIQPLPLDLRDLIADVLTDRPEHDRIRVHMPDEPVVVNADMGRLEQVLSNLLDNAVKFSPADADIDVELLASSSGAARLIVRDRGLGIPPEHRARVFDRFHQAHAESHRSGFGLGLYIAKQIVDLHAGSISLECPISGGTSIMVDLPQAGAVGTPVHQAA